jgi:hypothetical protein
MSLMAEYSLRSRDVDILASLRIGSDEYDLSKIASLLGISADKVHRKGERELTHAPDRYFTYHYNFINSGDDPLHDLGSVNPWLSCHLSSLEQAPSVPALLQSGTIEATLWIFISGYPPGSIPAVDPTVRRRAAKLNVSIYFEHYFESESDAETGPWPARLVIKHDTDDFIR